MTASMMLGCTSASKGSPIRVLAVDHVVICAGQGGPCPGGCTRSKRGQRGADRRCSRGHRAGCHARHRRGHPAGLPTLVKPVTAVSSSQSAQLRQCPELLVQIGARDTELLGDLLLVAFCAFAWRRGSSRRHICHRDRSVPPLCAADGVTGAGFWASISSERNAWTVISGPSQKITARSTSCSNWRTLPGHS